MPDDSTGMISYQFPFPSGSINEATEILLHRFLFHKTGKTPLSFILDSSSGGKKMFLNTIVMSDSEKTNCETYP